MEKSCPKPKMPFSILPRTVLETKSSNSGQIKVVEQLGRYRLYVGKMLQSGGLLEGVWKKTIKELPEAKKVLILGLGGGTVARQITVKWPGVAIVGVEIDPVIVKLGKNYFGLDEIPGLEIVIEEATAWVEKTAKEREKFDLVIIDTYLEDEMPQNCQKPAFFNTIKKIIAKNGVVVFNQLLVKGKQKRSAKAIEEFQKLFPRTKLVKTATNLLILGSF